MRNAWFNIARLSYIVTLAVCTVISLNAAGRLLTLVLAGYGDFFSAVAIALFLFPCFKAILRKLRGGVLLPRPEKANTRPYLIAITLTGLLGHFFFALFASAYVEIRLKHLSDVSGLGAVMVVTAVLYLVTLCIGELVASTSVELLEKGRSPFSDC